MRRLTKHHYLSVALLIFVALLTLPAIYNLFRPGFFATHDGEWMIIRFSAFYDALSDGQFPVRWLGRLNNLYGYPAPNFAYPLFMYLATPIHAIGFGIVNSVKILTIGTFVLGAVFSYVWLRKFFNPMAAILGSFIYTYTPYHVYNLYVRGSIGELLALAILPFILWQIERRSPFFTGVGIGLLMVSHNILAFLYLPLIIAYIVFRSKWPIKLSELVVTFVPIICGVGMSAFFFIPAVYDLQYIIFQKANLAVVDTNFVSIQLFGAASLLLLLLGSLLIVLRWKNNNKVYKEAIYRLLLFFVLSGWITWFLTNPISAMVWKILPTTILQYPFRLLCLLPIAAAFLGAYVLTSLKKHQLIGVVFLGIGVFITALPYLSPKEFFDRGDMYYANNFATTTVSNEYTPKWVEKQIFSIPQQKVEVTNGVVKELVSKSNLTEFVFVTSQSAHVKIHTTYFPGWQVFVDNKEIPVSFRNEYGIMSFPMPKGSYTISARFGETPIRLAADAVSVASFMMLSTWSMYRRKRK
jgi:hypothetical protein